LLTIVKPIKTKGYYIKGLKVLKNTTLTNLEFIDMVNDFKNKNKNLLLYKYDKNTYHIWKNSLSRDTIYLVDIKETKKTLVREKIINPIKKIIVNKQATKLVKIIKPKHTLNVDASLSLGYMKLNNNIQHISLQDKLKLSENKIVPNIFLNLNLDKKHFVSLNFIHYSDSTSTNNDNNFSISNNIFQENKNITSTYNYTWLTLTYTYKLDLFKVGIVTHIINNKLTIRNDDFKTKEEHKIVMPALNLSKDYKINNYKLNINLSAMKYDFYTYRDLNIKFIKENILSSKYNFISRFTLNKYDIDTKNGYKEDHQNTILYLGISRYF